MYDVIGSHNIALMTKNKENLHTEVYVFFFNEGEAVMRKKKNVVWNKPVVVKIEKRLMPDITQSIL